MEIRQLVTFIKVVQFQSFSKAAEYLGYSQSAVTVQIRLLDSGTVFTGSKEQKGVKIPENLTSFCSS